MTGRTLGPSYSTTVRNLLAWSNAKPAASSCLTPPRSSMILNPALTKCCLNAYFGVNSGCGRD
jgi:hypothetical protein